MRWLADENLRNAIVRGLLRRSPEFDIVRAQDLSQVVGQEDLVLLAWATRENRVVLTHDLATMLPAMQKQRLQATICAPIVLVPDSLSIGTSIEQILLLDACASESDWAPGVLYLPLR